ncbi:MAG TPA: arsenite methyltransferase [Candidatus Binatia bacterium]|nr:arsenite methyltransferase [Candidatus Binatia bacterium]
MNATPKQDPESIRDMVREGYAGIARGSGGCCGAATANRDAIARKIGYSEEDLEAVPAGANLGLGCGNPIDLARVRRGETVLDLGSGAGFDAFLAARIVGPEGSVVGVDMTPEMVSRAQQNARAASATNVEFRLGHIEALPIDDESVDVVISNCVINLSPEKDRVFREAWRVLRPGGRLAISDLVLKAPFPVPLRSVEAYVGCIAGAMLREDYLAAIRRAGFATVDVVAEASFSGIVDLQSPEIHAALAADGLTTADAEKLVENVVSLKVVARK